MPMVLKIGGGRGGGGGGGGGGGISEIQPQLNRLIIVKNSVIATGETIAGNTNNETP